MIAIYFEHFFEPLIGRQTFLKAYLTAQKSCVKLLSNYLRAQKSGFNLLSAFLSEFFFLSALLSTQKHTQGTSEPLCFSRLRSVSFLISSPYLSYSHVFNSNYLCFTIIGLFLYLTFLILPSPDSVMTHFSRYDLNCTNFKNNHCWTEGD